MPPQENPNCIARLRGEGSFVKCIFRCATLYFQNRMCLFFSCSVKSYKISMFSFIFLFHAYRLNTDFPNRLKIQMHQSEIGLVAKQIITFAVSDPNSLIKSFSLELGKKILKDNQCFR